LAWDTTRLSTQDILQLKVLDCDGVMIEWGVFFPER
jgi:hypothetical protein